jgi:tetratricopeptide (TPR) repeat protein
MKLTPALLIPLLLAPAGCAARRGPAGIPESAQYAELDLLRPFPGADKIYVQADLPGGETGIFLVDTGASTSLLTDEMAERLGVVGQPTDGVLAGLGGRVQLVEGRLPWVSLGGVVVGDVAVAVGTPSLGPFSAQIPLDGILGNNVWGHLEVAIDYPADVLELGLPGSIPVPESAERMSFDGQHLLVPLTLNAGEPGGDQVSRSLLLELDTGSRGVILTQYTGPGFEAVATEGEEPILGVGAAENMPMSAFYRPTLRVPLVSVELGGATVEDPGSAIWLTETSPQGALEMLGLVGHSVLKDHRLILDYPGGRFALVDSQREPRQLDGHEALLQHDVQRFGEKAPERGLYRAKLHAALEDLDSSLADLEGYLRVAPDDAEAGVARARVLLYQGRQQEYWQAVSAISPAGLVDQGELVAAVNWAALSGQLDRGLELAEAGVAARPAEPGALLALSDARYNSGDLAGSGEALQAASRLIENPDGYLMRRARLAMAEGDRYGALAHLRRRLSLYPTDGSALWFYALLAGETGDQALLVTLRADADRAWSRLHPQARPLDFALAVERLLGDQDKARSLMAEGLERDCDPIEEEPSRQNCQAWFRAMAGEELEEARGLIEAAVKAEPNRSDFLDTQAMIYLELGEFGPAADAARAAALASPDVIYHLWQAERINALNDGRSDI